MNPLRATLRKFLLRRRLVLSRLDGPAPPTLREALHGFRTEMKHRADGRIPGVRCVDGDLQIQTDLLSIFGESGVAFLPDLAAWRGEKTPGCYLVILDAGSVEPVEILKDEDALREVETILLRFTLGLLWSGDRDLGRMTRTFREAGFSLRDALGTVGLLSWSAPTESVVFVFGSERTGVARPPTAEASARTAEALAVFSPPLARSGSLRRLAGRGSFGFTSGLLNPGASRWRGRTILLARGERSSWAAQQTDEVTFINSARPVLLEPAPDATAKFRARELTLSGGDPAAWCNSRVEDFRLFRFREDLFSNCALTSVAGGHPQEGRALQLETLTTRVGLARLDPDGGTLDFLGTPRLDRPTGRVEKNWAMFEAGGELHLIYSFAPYRLLRAARWPELDFTTVRESEIRPPPNVLPAVLRNSINPVEYDERHFLHVVHAVFPVKRYFFWAVLIDKATLLPAMVSAGPLVGGWPSAPASIIYVTAVVPGADEIEIYGGLNDSSIGCWTLRRDRLDTAWLPFTR